MEELINWLNTKDLNDLLQIGLIVAFIMFIIPYLSQLEKLFFKIIRWQRLDVIKYGYHFLISDNLESDFVIEGGKVLLFWEIKGALSIKIYPHIGSVTGDSAELIVHRNRRKFEIHASGLFQRKILKIEIPHDKIKVLETREISETKAHSLVKDVQATPFTVASNNAFSFTGSPAISERINHMKGPMTSKLNFELPSSFQTVKEKLNERIKTHKFLKIYSFSTLKYKSVFQLKPFKSKIYE
jgi:hypothetical protein